MIIDQLFTRPIFEAADPSRLIATITLAKEYNADEPTKEIDLTGRFQGDVKSQMNQAADYLTQFLQSKGFNFTSIQLKYQGMVMNAQNRGSMTPQSDWEKEAEATANQMRAKRSVQNTAPALKEFAPSDDDSNGSDSEEMLRRMASHWWNGNERQMAKVENTLAAMGWEIGQDDGYDDGGVFVVRAGDEHGRSYISWPHEDLELNEGRKKKKSSRSLGRYFFPGYGYYGSGDAGEGGGDGGGGESAKPGMSEGSDQQLSVRQLATISDEALDKAYGYGRSSPGNTFGWQANLKSAAYAKHMIDKGVTDIDEIADAIHKGWNVTARAFVKNPNRFDDTEKLKAAGKLEAKLQQRAKLMNIDYSQLPDDEQEKDRVVARALLQAITGGGKQGMSEVADPSRRGFLKKAAGAVAAGAAMSAAGPEIVTLVKGFAEQAGGMNGIQALKAMLKIATPAELYNMYDYYADSGILEDAITESDMMALDRAGYDNWSEFEEHCDENGVDPDDEFKRLTGQPLKVSRVDDILGQVDDTWSLEDFFDQYPEAMNIINPPRESLLSMRQLANIDTAAKGANLPTPIVAMANAVAGLVRQIFKSNGQQLAAPQQVAQTGRAAPALPAPTRPEFDMTPDLKQKEKVPMQRKGDDEEPGDPRKTIQLLVDVGALSRGVLTDKSGMITKEKAQELLNKYYDGNQDMAEGEYDSRKPFGVRYKVFAGREGRMTTREYWTSSEEKLQRAVDKIQALDNFYEIDGYSYPKESQDLTEVFADQGSGSTDRDNADYMKRRNAAKKAGYTSRETKAGTWRVFKDGNAVAAAGPFKSADEAAAWIKKHKQGVTEMDKSEPSAGRDGPPRPGPDREAKPVAAKKATRDAGSMLNRAFKDSHKKKDVKEANQEIYSTVPFELARTAPGIQMAKMTGQSAVAAAKNKLDSLRAKNPEQWDKAMQKGSARVHGPPQFPADAGRLMGDRAEYMKKVKSAPSEWDDTTGSIGMDPQMKSPFPPLMKKLQAAMVREGRVKELADDLKTMNDTDFMKKYGKAKAAIRRDMKRVDEAQTNYTPAEMSDILSGKKTQQQVDAERAQKPLKEIDAPAMPAAPAAPAAPSGLKFDATVDPDAPARPQNFSRTFDPTTKKWTTTAPIQPPLPDPAAWRKAPGPGYQTNAIRDRSRVNGVWRNNPQAANPMSQDPAQRMAGYQEMEKRIAADNAAARAGVDNSDPEAYDFDHWLDNGMGYATPVLKSGVVQNLFKKPLNQVPPGAKILPQYDTYQQQGEYAYPVVMGGVDQAFKVRLDQVPKGAKIVQAPQQGGALFKNLPGAAPATPPAAVAKPSTPTAQPAAPINELSTNKLAQYKTAAAKDAKRADQAGDFKRGDRRLGGMVQATKKQFDNDAKKVDESRAARRALMARIVNSR